MEYVAGSLPCKSLELSVSENICITYFQGRVGIKSRPYIKGKTIIF